MSSDWIEGRFEGVYSGQRVERYSDKMLSGARQFSFELQSGQMRDVQAIAAPSDVDPNGDATSNTNGAAKAADDTIRLKRIEHISMPRLTPQGPARHDDDALEASRETCLFDVRIHDWRLAHPAEVAGRSYGTLYGTIRARLTPAPAVEERPLELTSVTSAAARDRGGASGISEDAEAASQRDGLSPSSMYADSDDPALTIARFWWAMRILAVLFVAAGLAYGCSPRNAEIWLAPTLVALLGGLVGTTATHRHPLWQHGLGCALVALQLAVLFGPAELAWQRGCLPAISSQLLWLGAPVAVAGWMRIRWPFWLTAALWTAVLCSWCSQLEGSCSAPPTTPVAVTSNAANHVPGTPNPQLPAGSRTQADGRWPIMPSASWASWASSISAVPPSGANASSTQTTTAIPSAPVTAAGFAGTDDRSPSDPGAAFDASSAMPRAATARGALEPLPLPRPLPLEGATDSKPLRSDRVIPNSSSPEPSGSARGGWVTPDHREDTRTAMMISIEHANRVPDEFYASPDERRVYLPTDNIFVHGGSSLRPGGDIELMRVSALLSLPDKPRVQIEVHTDAGGSRAKQLELSRRRAANIRSWLLARGHIDAQRFDVRGVGSSRPVVPPDGSYTSQSPNRRLEIRVVE